MSLYSGNSITSIDLISRSSISYDEIIDIADQYIGPKIGEIRFITKFISYEDLGLQLYPDNTVRITGDFEGWTYPDGKNYYKENFPTANSIYKDNDVAQFFQIPKLDNFIRSSNTSLTQNEFKNPINQKNDILKHNHGLTETGTLDSNFTIKDGFAFYAAGDCNSFSYVNIEVGKDKSGASVYAKIPKFHNGNASTDKVPLPLDVTMKTSDLKTIFSDGETEQPIDPSDSTKKITTSGNFIPEHFKMPCMIYIGKPANKNFPNANSYTVAFKYKNEDYQETEYRLNVIEYNSATPPNIPTLNGYIFEKWSSDEYNRVVRDLTGDNAIQAVYSLQTYTVTYHYGQNNATTKVVNLKYKENAYVLAPSSSEVQVEGKTFIGWNVKTSDLQSVERDIDAYAQYGVKVYSIIDESVNGKISGANESYDYGTVVQLQAIPNAGYRFVKWNDTGDTDPNRSVTVNSDITLKAIFEQIYIQSIIFFKKKTAHDQILQQSYQAQITARQRTYEFQNTIQQIFDEYPDKPEDFVDFTYSYIDWGDSTHDIIQKSKADQKCYHTYEASGTYDIKVKFVYIINGQETLDSNGRGFEVIMNGGKTCTANSISTEGYDTQDCLQKKDSIFDVICCKVTYSDGSSYIEDGLYPKLNDNTYHFYRSNKKCSGLKFIQNDVQFDISWIPSGSYKLYTDSSLIIEDEETVDITYSYNKDKNQEIYAIKEIWFNLNSLSENHYDYMDVVYSTTLQWSN